MKTKHILISVLLIVMLGLLTAGIKEVPTVESPVDSEIMIEDNIMVECWMIEPFMIVEEPLELEDWMTKPFPINKKS